jgi:ubiquinone biosynthesis protein COQ9
VLLDSKETKEKILAEFLKVCAFDGWSNDALLKAISNCGIEEKFCNLIFENGCLDVVEFYIETYNQKTALIIEKNPQQKIRDKIRFALYARFEVEKDNQLALQRLSNFYLNPKNFTKLEIGARPLLQAFKDCFKISDFIWKSFNDQSTDFNFYTKRLTLAKIILRSFSVFVKDESENFTQTKNFIDSQIEKVMKFEKFKAQLKNMANKNKTIFKEFFCDEKGSPKSPKELIKNLPFFRLIKK